MVLFRLAEKLGYLDPDAMGDVLPAALLSQWVAYWKVRAEVERAAVESMSRK